MQVDPLILAEPTEHDWWVPAKPGDQVAGRVLERGKARTHWGPREYLLLEQAVGGKIKVLLIGALVERWRDAAPGWRVEATYLGRVARFRRFRCAAESPGSAQSVS